MCEIKPIQLNQLQIDSAYMKLKFIGFIEENLLNKFVEEITNEAKAHCLDENVGILDHLVIANAKCSWSNRLSLNKYFFNFKVMTSFL